MPRLKASFPVLRSWSWEIDRARRARGRFPAQRQAASDPVTYGRALRLVADLGIVEAKFADAEAAARKAVEAMERYLGPTHPETAAAFRTLGEVVSQDHQIDRALDLSARALERTLAAHQDHRTTRGSCGRASCVPGAGDAGQLDRRWRS
jgi:hypothetical protein